MLKRECDILIIGGGVAGLSAAICASKNAKDAKIILVEEDCIGENVQCAECVGKYLIPSLPKVVRKTLKKNLLWSLRGIRFVSINLKKERIKKSGIFSSYTIDRSGFERNLASLAEKNDVELLPLSKVVGVKASGDCIGEVIIAKGKENFAIKPKIVIIADGARSPTLKLMNKYKKEERNFLSYVVCKNVETELLNAEYMHEFVGLSYGYGFIMPKGSVEANIGVASVLKYSGREQIENLFQKFLKILNERGEISKIKIVKDQSGYVSIDKPTTDIQFGNCLVAGDAAGQALLPYAEGIIPCSICGYVAGEVASKAFVNEDLGILKEYETKLLNKWILIKPSKWFILPKKVKSLYKLSDDLRSIFFKICEISEEEKREELLLRFFSEANPGYLQKLLSNL